MSSLFFERIHHVLPEIVAAIVAIKMILTDLLVLTIHGKRRPALAFKEKLLLLFPGPEVSGDPGVNASARAGFINFRIHKSPHFLATASPSSSASKAETSITG